MSTLEHSRHQTCGQEIGAADVGVEGLLESIESLVNGEGGGKAGRVVDQDVDVAGLLDKRSNGFDVRHVGLDEPHAAIDARRRGLTALCVSAGDDDRGALA